jgi:hypothetical protein
VLDQHEAGTAANEAKAAYAQAMAPCEGLMKLAPLSTAIRVLN